MRGCWEQNARGQWRSLAADFSFASASDWTIIRPISSFPSWRRVRISQKQSQKSHAQLKLRNRSTNQISPLRPLLSAQPIACRETELGAQQLVVRVSLCNPSERGSSRVRVCKYKNLHIVLWTELRLVTVQSPAGRGQKGGTVSRGRPGAFRLVAVVMNWL